MVGRIRAIDHTWEEFHKEVQRTISRSETAHRTDRDKQSYGQYKGDFVLQKIQLSRIRNTGLDEENAVETTIELTRPEYQNLIQVQKPKRFMDLNEATYMVADQTQKRGKSHLEKPEPEKT